MRSFIKSHRRGSSATASEGSFLESFSQTEELIGANGSNSPGQSSPGRNPPSSPTTLNKGSNKLQRLFLRSKLSSPNLSNYSSTFQQAPSPKSPPPTIVGTRTHEWGNNTSTTDTKSFSKVESRRRSEQSKRSSANSLLSLGESNLTNISTSTNNIQPQTVAIDESLELQLSSSLDTSTSTSTSRTIKDKSSKSRTNLKNYHRRVQIIGTNDNPYELDDAPMIIPGRTFQSSDEDSDITEGVPDSDEHQKKNYSSLDPKPQPTTQISDVDETVIQAISMEKVRKQSSIIEPIEEKERENENDSKSLSGISEFSFEEDNKRGRNVSIKYYKNPIDSSSPKNVVKESGFYVNDLVDDNFDEDMNYYDEYDDEFNDDEELFNKKYFSDDENEDYKPVDDDIKKDSLPQKIDSDTSNLSISQKLRSPIQTTLPEVDSETAYVNLGYKRSLKFHQVPVILDQEYSVKRYSWLSDDEDVLANPSFSKRNSTQSYESLLDEINGVPEDYEFTESNKSVPQATRSKSTSSSIRRTKSLVEDTVQPTKFETNNKTVTLFNRSSYQSSSASSNVNEQFGYMTPNNSFSMPEPGFSNDQNELSPISEGFSDASYSP